MRLAIVGAGATGGYLGACLARAGADVVLVARGPHLAAMRERGLRFASRTGRLSPRTPSAQMTWAGRWARPRQFS